VLKEFVVYSGIDDFVEFCAGWCV